MSTDVLLDAAAELDRRADEATDPARADWLKQLAAGLRLEASE